MPLADTVHFPKGCLRLSVPGHWCPTTRADMFQEVKLSLSWCGRRRMNTGHMNMTSLGYIPVCWPEIDTRRFRCFCYMPSRASGISGFPEIIFHFLMWGEQKRERWREHTENNLWLNPERLGNLHWFWWAQLKRALSESWEGLPGQPWIFLK